MLIIVGLISENNTFNKFRKDDWEIPQLIHLISIAIEFGPMVDELRDDERNPTGRRIYQAESIGGIE